MFIPRRWDGFQTKCPRSSQCGRFTNEITRFAGGHCTRCSVRLAATGPTHPRFLASGATWPSVTPNANNIALLLCIKPFALIHALRSISHLAKVVLDDEWITFSPPTGNKPAAKSMIALAKEHEMGHHIEWKDIGTCLEILQKWQDSSGQFEKFDGTFMKFFEILDSKITNRIPIRNLKILSTSGTSRTEKTSDGTS